MSKLTIKSDEHFRKYENLIKSWASTYHRANLGDFDDMYQEASMVYLRTCDAYKENMSKFSTFLYTSLRNNMFDMLRKKKNEIELLSLDAPIGEGDDEESMTFIDTIPSEHHHVEGEIMRMLYQGMNITEISRYLKVNRSTVYRRLEKEREHYGY